MQHAGVPFGLSRDHKLTATNAIMKTTKLLLSALPLLAALGFTIRATADEIDQSKLTTEVQDAIKAFKASDSSMTNHFKKAVGYAVFPTAGKGGLIVGGAHGTGQVYEGGKLIGNSKMSQVTVGAQIGGQAFAEIIFFKTKEALAKFKEGGYSFNAQVGAVAAAEGASLNAKYVDGVLVFTEAKSGLMAEATVGGQKFTFVPIAQ
jgi:lipid-binding SYLF domain-containing protein